MKKDNFMRAPIDLEKDDILEIDMTTGSIMTVHRNGDMIWERGQDHVNFSDFVERLLKALSRGIE
ncbi:MAG: hypothetical protein WC648_04850 [Candidatus Paceibacterota bacterium]|jgi:hypothetical protein